MATVSGAVNVGMTVKQPTSPPIVLGNKHLTPQQANDEVWDFETTQFYTRPNTRPSGHSLGRYGRHRLRFGRCGAVDGQFPAGERQVGRRRRQEGRRPPVRLPVVPAEGERNDAKADQDGTAADAHACPKAQATVLPGRDHAPHAGSRGRCPPPPQTFRSGVVIGCVHRDASCVLRYRPFRYPPLNVQQAQAADPPCGHPIWGTASTVPLSGADSAAAG